MDKPQIIAHVNKSLDYTLFDTKWIPISSKFVVVGSTPRGTGKIQIYDITTTDVKLLSESEKSKSFKCCTLGASPIPSYHLATGAFDGRLAIWDIERDDRLDQPIYGVQAHEEIINCIDSIGGAGVGEGAPEILTGSRDGCVKVWDPRQKNAPVVTIKPNLPENHKEQSKRDCWAVAFGNAYTKYDRTVVAGYDNGDLKMFDLRTMKVTWETNLKNGIVSLEFDRKDIEMNKLLATTLEGNLHVFDTRTKHPKKGYASLCEKVNNSTIWQVKHLPQQRDIFMTTSGSGAVSLWKYNYPLKRRRETIEEIDGQDVKLEEGVIGSLDLLQTMTLSTQPISSFSWCAEKLGLAISVGFDQTLRVLIVTKLREI